MANDIRIGIDVDDGGKTAALVKHATALKDQYEGVVAAAKRIPVATGAAKQGIAARAAAAQPDGGASDTNLSRGISGSTGASGRDFAAQAQGLGGLVHVYATFAANLFAVSAAFNALSKAMDTSNLVKGLDQLGASSGRTFSTLAKQMVAVSDGAISMREAMTATAMATSAGMSNANVLRMTAVAQKASLALGRDLPDSLDRLTKGIVKTQPELLDELGIMTRVIPASQEYARSIGKTIGELTTFEKQQGFANAVLAEGEAKFGNIKIESNPYSKLLASMTNLAVSGLNLVNTVLSPIAKLLSESPTGLAVAMAAVAGVLIKQAIPAIGQYKEGLEKLKNINLSKVAKLSDVVAESGTYDATMSARVKQQYLDKNEYAKQSNEVRARLLAEANDIEETYREKAVERGNSLLGHETLTNKMRDRLYKETAASNIKYNTAQVQSAYGMMAALSEMNAGIKASKAGEQIIDLGHGMEATAPKTGNLANGFLRLTTTIGILGTAAMTLMAAFAPWIEILALVGVGFAILDSQMTNNAAEQEKYKISVESSTAAIKTVGDAMEFLGKKSTNIFSLDSITAMTNALAGVSGSLEDQLNAYNRLILTQGKYEKSWDWIHSLVGGGDLNSLIKSFSTALPAAINTMILTGKSTQIKGLFNDILHVDPENTIGVENALKALSKPEAEAALAKLQKGMKKFSDEEQRTTSALTDFKNSLTEINKLSDDLTNSIKLTGTAAIGENLIRSASSLGIALLDPVKSLEAIRAIANDAKTMSFLPPNVQQELLTAKVQADDLARSLDKAMKARAESVDKTTKLKASGGYESSNANVQIGKDILVGIGGAIGGGIAAVFTAGLGTATGTAIGMGVMGYVGNEMEKRFPSAKDKTLAGINADREQKQELAQVVKVQNRIAAFTQAQSSLVDSMNEAGYSRIVQGLKYAGEQASLVIQKAMMSAKAAAGLGTAKDEYNLAIQDINIKEKLIEVSYNQAIAVQENTEALNKLNAQQSKRYAAEDLANPATKAEDKPALQAIVENSGKFLNKMFLSSILKVSGQDLSKFSTADIKSAEMYNKTKDIPRLQKEIALKGTGAEKVAAGINYGVSSINDQAKAAGKILDLDTLTNKTLIDRIALNQKLSSGYSETLSNVMVSAQIAKEELSLKQQSLPIQTELNHLTAEPITVERDNAITLNKEKLKQLRIGTNIVIASIQAAAIDEKFTQNQKKITDAITLQKTLQDQVDIIANSRLSLQEQELANAMALNNISETYFANSKADILLKKEEITSASNILAAQNALNIAKEAQAEIDRKIAIIPTAGANLDPAQTAAFNANKPDLSGAKLTADSAVIEADAKLNTAKSQTEINKLTIENQRVQDLILATEKDILDKQALHMEKMVSLTDNLATAFGAMGDAIGKASEALITMADEDTNYLRRKQQLQEIIYAGMDNQKNDAKVKAGTEAEIELNKLETKHVKDRLKNENSVLSAAKKSLDQQSAGYKILTGLEKAKAALTSLGSAQALSDQIKIVGEMVTKTIPSIYAMAMSQLGPIAGPIAATAAIAAFVGGEFGSGSGGSAPAEFNYDTYKTSKGGYNAGTVDTGGGTTALNTGLADSLNTLVSLAKPELPLTSKMTRYLASINDNIASFAGLYKLNYLGNNAGATGFTPSSSSSSGSSLLSAGVGAAAGAFGGTVISAALAGISQAGVALMNFGGTVGSIGATVAEGVGLFNDGLMVLAEAMPGWGTAAAILLSQIPMVSDAIGSFLVGTDNVSTAMQGYGLEIKAQTLDQATSNVALSNYMDVLTTSTHEASTLNKWTGGLAGQGNTSSTEVNHIVGPAEQAAIDAVQGMFKSIKSNLTEASKALGIGTDNIGKLTTAFSDIDTKAGTDAEILARVNGAFGNMSDNLVRQLLPNIQDYTMGQETATATYNRLASSAELAAYYTDILNIKTVDYTKVLNKHSDISAEMVRQSILASESLSGINDIIGTISGNAGDIANTYLNLKDVQTSFVTMGMSADLIGPALIRGSGGIDALKSSLSDFQTNFLDKADQTAIKQAKMNTEFDKLGLATPKTAEGFKALVQELASGGVASSELLGRVLLLSGGMKDLVGSISDVMSADIKIYGLLGNTSLALAKSRQQELEAMSATQQPLQIYINALTDEVAIRDKLKAAYLSTNSALTNSIKTLEDYKIALNAGASSTLTPAEKYAEAKSKLLQTAAQAQMDITTASSAADVATRDAALAKIPALSDSFLGLSREVNASTAQYTTDFTSVNDMIDATSGILSTQQTDLQSQLKYLEDTTTASQTIATLMADLVVSSAATAAAVTGAVAAGSTAASTMPKFASGGLARGVSLVGENGPEVVDFKNPGRVYSNQASNDLFNTKELVAEIKALRNEVAQLRDDQNKQTGDIIQTNYDANNKNAETITIATQTAAQQQSWKTRSQVNIA